FAFWRLGLFVITYFGSKILPPASNGALGAPTFAKAYDYWLSWAQWDGGYYFRIAQSGYSVLNDYAFLPLYPTLLHLLDVLVKNTLLSGLLISNFSTLIFLIVFYKFLKETYPKFAKSTLITFLCFPTTFFAVAFYSEGLFLLLVAATFYFMYKNKYFYTTLAIILASLTRIVGIFLVVSFAYKYFATFRKIESKVVCVFTSAAGFIAYALFLFSKLGNPFAFVGIQSLWTRNIDDPLSTIFSYIIKFISAPNQPLDQYFDFIVTVFFIGVLIWGIKKINSSLWIFSMLVILIPASSGTLTSMPRYVLSSLGAFVVIGSFLEDHPKLKIPVWTISLTLQALLAVKFISGYWVA
ncbi:MAG TPA: hypothetical protein VLE91_02755, partial [Candidatus Saccharimonadales bacterium]|nr:hypothetical protein [Candidatus Saccharimonadales bacterium]